MRLPGGLLVMVTLGGMLACERRAASADSARGAGHGVAAGGTTGVASLATPGGAPERPMAQRREAQPLLDSATDLLSRGDRAGAARLLNRAAAFFLVQAASPQSAGSPDLVEASHDLDSLAGDLRRSARVDAGRLRRLSAHTNLAEAERHAALAAVAWSTRSKESVADELTMSVDHVERAARDAGMPLTVSLRRILAEMRTTASQLAARHEVDVQTLDEPLAALHGEIRAMHARLAREDTMATRRQQRQQGEPR